LLKTKVWFSYLFGESDEFSGLDEVGSLKSTDGGEGPAGSATSLVLDSRLSSSGEPVNRLGDLSLGSRDASSSPEV